MSGLCAVFTTESKNKTLVTQMLSKIRHRGPDKDFMFSSGHFHGGICMKKDVDYKNNDMPYHIDRYDGCVYFDGYIEDLTGTIANMNKNGIPISGTTTAEQLFSLYRVYGADMVKHIHGAFVIVLFDKIKNKIVMMRDRFGCKPIYYTMLGSAFFIASEIKAFIGLPGFEPAVNHHALEQYLSFQFSPLAETFFSGVYKLLPAHTLIFDQQTITTERYYTVDYKPVETTLERASTVLDGVIMKAVDDVRNSYDDVGAFLSGGVDSGYLAAANNKGKTFTVGFDNTNFNEIAEAKQLSDQLNLEHISTMIDPDEYFNHLPNIMYSMDEPLADPAAIAFYFACREASKYVHVALSGEGPDEFFGGYGIYREPIDLNRIKFLPKKLLPVAGKVLKLCKIKKGVNYLKRAEKPVEDRFIGNAFIFNKAQREEILTSFSEPAPQNITQKFYDVYQHHDDVTKMQLIDINLWLPGDILLQADKMSQAFSLAVRTPFMASNVLKIALQLPTKLRVNKKYMKHAFRVSAAKHIPKEIAFRKKLGFPVPIRFWLKDEKYFSIVQSYFLNETAQQYFNTQKLMEMLYDHKNEQADNCRKIWTVFMFLVWHQVYIENKGDI